MQIRYHNLILKHKISVTNFNNFLKIFSFIFSTSLRIFVLHYFVDEKHSKFKLLTLYVIIHECQH